MVDRTDMVRIFVDIPEQDANYVQIGTKATVLARAYRDQELPATVTRTSWALNVKSRTLRAEIDLPNPDSQILPGMYAYGKVIIERPGVRALPLDALVYSGDQTFCWPYENGQAVRTEIETGVSDGEWIEVTNRRVPRPGKPADKAPWTPIDGSEQVILGDLSILTDGTPVKIARRTKVATAAARSGESLEPGRDTRLTHERAVRSAGRRRRPVAHRGQVGGRVVSTGTISPGGLRSRSRGGVAQRVEQLELRPVVLGDRGEVLVEGELQELERVDRLLRPVDQDQDVAEAGGLPQALVVAVEGDDAVRRARSAWPTRAAADWRRAWAWVTSAATMSWVLGAR